MHSHNYDHSHSHEADTKTLKNLIVAFTLNFSFAILELIGGIISNSVILITDSVHDFGDSLVILSGIGFQILSAKKRSDNYTYGYRRFSLLGALFTVIILLISSMFMFRLAIKRFLNPEVVDVKLVLIIGIFGLLVNGISIWRMAKSSSMMDRTMMLHLMEDLFGWIAAIIGALLIAFFEVYRIDSVIALIIALFIFVNALLRLRDISYIFLQKVPKTISVSEVEAKLFEYEMVKEVVDLHIWSLEGEDVILSCQLVVEDNEVYEILEIKNDIKDKLEEYGINHSTIEVTLAG